LVVFIAEDQSEHARAMDTVAVPPPEEHAVKPYRCARCGVESLASDCFIVPEETSTPPQDVRCITCERVRSDKRSRRTIVSFAVGLLLITALLVRLSGVEPASALILAFLASCLMQPIVVILHELGHALTARALGLEVGAVLIGTGRLVGSIEFFGMPVHFYAWPVFGRTYVGAYQVRAPMPRLWLSVLMGPGANALVVWATVAYWHPLSTVVHPLILMMWMVLNLMSAGLNLLPFTFSELGQIAYSDGMLLMRLRRSYEGHSFEVMAPWLRALCRYERHDYAGALQACEEGLARKQDDPDLRIVKAACLFCTGQYGAALETLQPLLDDGRLTESQRAIARNNAALALAVLHGGTATESSGQLAEAEKLSFAAFSAYPCLVSIRGTRALVLAARGQSEASLQLLDYLHYETASASERSYKAFAQALAFRALGRMEDARRAALAARQLDPMNANMMSRFGFTAQA
jgi:Tetratricopeptide repeat